MGCRGDLVGGATVACCLELVFSLMPVRHRYRRTAGEEFAAAILSIVVPRIRNGGCRGGLVEGATFGIAARPL